MGVPGIDPAFVPGAEEQIPARLSGLERRVEALERTGRGLVPVVSVAPTVTSPEGAMIARKGATRKMYIVLDGAVREWSVT